MIQDNEKRYLLKRVLSQKLYFSEVEEKLVSITYSLMEDNAYTIDCAIPELIKIINLLELEQQAIMLEINRILELSD